MILIASSGYVLLECLLKLGQVTGEQMPFDKERTTYSSSDVW
jgi:hypothetical protein